MNITDMAKTVQKILHDNSSTILTALGVSGTLTTAYLAAKASFRASFILAEEERLTTKRVETKEAVKQVWKLYIPTAVSGVLTIGCIIAGTRIGTKKAAAAYSLLSVSEKAFTEYKTKVVEQIGDKKEKAIHDAIAQDRVNQTPTQGVVVVGSGNVLCYEMHTGRYFNCDIETLRKAQNTINAMMIREVHASLSDFYYLIGMPYTSQSSGTGWDSDKMLELSFSTVLSDDGRPCISFEYNYVKPL